MEDMERYGDYNEVDEPPSGGRKNIVAFVIKAIVLLACAAVVAVLGFRMYLFNYYPDKIKDIYFTENLINYYNTTDGNIGALTQTLQTPYDDPDEGNFFCDNLIVIKGAGELQVSLRFNTSAVENMEKELGLTGLSADDPELLTFRLYKSGESEVPEDHLIGECTLSLTESKLMYRYYKLAFDGIDFGEGENKIEWIRLEVFVKGQTSEEPYAMVPIYEDNENYSHFTEYELKEAPN